MATKHSLTVTLSPHHHHLKNQIKQVANLRPFIEHALVQTHLQLTDLGLIQPAQTVYKVQGHALSLLSLEERSVTLFIAAHNPAQVLAESIEHLFEIEEETWAALPTITLTNSQQYTLPLE